MALFGRRKKNDLTDEDLGLEDEVGEPARPQPAEGEPGVDRDWVRAEDGPYDVSEAEELDGRLDLGALRVPVLKGMQVRLDLEQGSSRVIGLTLGFGSSHAQIQAFAAPRSFGLWDELRPEIARGLVEAGGAAEAVAGPLGKELRARMPGRAPDGRVAFQPARFLGIDGPRWFLRIVVNGPAATDDGQMRAVLGVLRQIVVSRGDDPRPPREVLTLTPPKGFEEAMAKEAEQRKARLAQERAAAAARAATQTQVLRTGDATGVAGVSIGGAVTGAAGVPEREVAPPRQGEPTEEPAPAAAPEPTDAPKAPNNPDFQ